MLKGLRSKSKQSIDATDDCLGCSTYTRLSNFWQCISSRSLVMSVATHKRNRNEIMRHERQVYGHQTTDPHDVLRNESPRRNLRSVLETDSLANDQKHVMIKPLIDN